MPSASVGQGCWEMPSKRNIGLAEAISDGYRSYFFTESQRSVFPQPRGVQGIHSADYCGSNCNTLQRPRFIGGPKKESDRPFVLGTG